MPQSNLLTLFTYNINKYFRVLKSKKIRGGKKKLEFSENEYISSLHLDFRHEVQKKNRGKIMNKISLTFKLFYLGAKVRNIFDAVLFSSAARSSVSAACRGFFNDFIYLLSWMTSASCCHGSPDDYGIIIVAAQSEILKPTSMNGLEKKQGRHETRQGLLFHPRIFIIS